MTAQLDYDFNSPPDANGHYHVLVDPDEVSVGEECEFGDSECVAPGRVLSIYHFAIVERTGDIFCGD